MSNPEITVAMLNERGMGRLPGHLLSLIHI